MERREAQFHCHPSSLGNRTLDGVATAAPAPLYQVPGAVVRAAHTHSRILAQYGQHIFLALVLNSWIWQLSGRTIEMVVISPPPVRSPVQLGALPAMLIALRFLRSPCLRRKLGRTTRVALFSA